jgi:hypothetical protein
MLLLVREVVRSLEALNYQQPLVEASERVIKHIPKIVQNKLHSYKRDVITFH